MASKAVIDTLIAEAGGEGEQGLIAAAWAIQQRAAARGVSIDRVVKSGFDGYSNPGSGAVKAQGDPALRARVEQIMSGVEAGSIPNPVPGADHFLSGDVMPSWAKGMKLVATVGGHRFYASGKVPESAQGNSVGTQLDVARAAPTPAKASAAMVAKRNPQNMKAAADVGLTDRNAVTPSLTKNGQGVTDPAGIVFGKQMTTALPQKPGQSVIERTPAVAKRSVSDMVRGNGLQTRSKARTVASTPTTGIGQPPATRVVQSVPVSAPKPRQPTQAERLALLAVPRQPAVTKVAGGIAGSVALPPGVRPNVPSTTPRAPKTDPIGTMPSFSSMSSLGTASQAAANLANVPGPNAAPKTNERLANTPSVALGFVPGQTAPQTKAQVEAATGFRLPGTQSALTTTAKEVENPAYAALMKRVQQGEIELRGMTASGMPLSRDGRARYDASMKAVQARLEAERKKLATTQRTTVVQQTARAPVQTRPVAVQPVSAVQAFRNQGYSPADAYDAANRASVERAIANSSNPAQARRLNERLGNI